MASPITIASKYQAIGFPTDVAETTEATEVTAPATEVEGEVSESTESVEETAEATEVDSSAEQTAETTEAAETVETETAEATPLLDEAVERYGFSREEAEQLGESLPKVLARMDRQAIELVRKEQASTEIQPEKPVKTEPKAEPTQPLFKKIEIKDLGIDADDYTDAQIKTFQTIADEMNRDREVMAALAELAVANHGSLKQVTEKTESQADAEFASDMDSFFAGLGDEFKDVYGKTAMAKLSPGSSLVENRKKLVSEMKILEDVVKRKGETLSVKELARRANRALHDDKLVVAARKDVQKQITTLRKQAIASPSGRNTKPADPRARALAFLNEKIGSGALN